MTNYYTLLRGYLAARQAGQTVVDWYNQVNTPKIDALLGHGDTIDAWRHGAVAAILAYDNGYDTATTIANAHESYKTNRPINEMTQDYWNDRVGIMIGTVARLAGMTLDEIGPLVQSAFANNSFMTDANRPGNVNPTIDLGYGVTITQTGIVTLKDGSRFDLKESTIFNDGNSIPVVSIVYPDGHKEIKILDDSERSLLKQGLSSWAPHCFLAGTPILMADGTDKPIENIRPGDEVMAFAPQDSQGLGPLQPRKVTRRFENVSKAIINLRGLKMTPGHVVLTDNGEWLKIAEVLVKDRAIIEQKGDQALPVRARTGAVIGTVNDIPVQVLFNDPVTATQRIAVVRAGIPAIGKKLDKTTVQIVTLAEVLAMQGYTIEANGTIICAEGKTFNATPWPGTGTPGDLDLQDVWVIAIDGKPYAPRWILDLPLEEEDLGQMVVNGPSGPSMMVGPKTGSSLNRNYLSLASSRPTSDATPLNRKARRKQAALHSIN